MRYLRPISLAFVLCCAAVLLCRCDFPEDPPLKPRVTTPPTIDTAHTLLPLNENVGWVYHVVVRGQQTQSYITYAQQINMSSGSYYQVTYSYSHYAPPRTMLAFPQLLKNVDSGLGFYNMSAILDPLTEVPKFRFMLPYPSEVGVKMEWTDTSKGTPVQVEVTVVSKDTTIADFTGAKRSVYRYDVVEDRKDRTTYYVLPGKALLRIEMKDATFHTIAWIGI
jgi:hypothetical protein